MSWIHIKDLVRAMLLCLENDKITGAINLTTPHPVQQKNFVKELAKIKKVPDLAIIPRFFLNVALGEAANVVVSSLKVIPKKLLNSDFKFSYSDLALALKSEIRPGLIDDRHYFKDQFVPFPPETVFPFFCRAENLESLTPPWLKFKIVKKSTDDVQVGSIIDYKLKIHGLPVRWKTKISSWQKNEYFIDEQLTGPYTKWHHRHIFLPAKGGCLLCDEISYRVPLSFFGDLMLGSWIKKDIEKIFNYRQEQIIKLAESGGLK